MTKIKIYYDERDDIKKSDVDFVSIKVDYFHPCVTYTYTTDNKSDLLELSDDFLTLPIENFA